MKTHTISTYSFNELSPHAQQCALDKHREFLGSVWESDCTQEDAAQCLAFAGFNIEKILFTGFWSQGDGACFEGAWRAADVNPAEMRQHAPLDQTLHRIADGLAAVAASYPQASFRVKHRGHYCHKYCTEFYFDLFGDAEPSALQAAGADGAEKELAELARDAMEWIYRQLEKDYDWQTAEPQVRESIEANAYEFNEDGTIY